METDKFDLRKIPKGWEVIEFQETVTKISTNGKKVKQKEYLERGAIPVIDQGQELIGGFTDDRESAIDCGLPVLVFGDHTKVVKLVTFPFAPGADGIKVIKPLSIFLPKLFASFVRVLVHKIPDKGYARHFQHLEKTNIPLPPLPEQHRIVDKIEELFSDLDDGIASLKKAQQQLKVYRQAVLKWAFEGKLTAQWREEQKRQGKLESADTLLEQIKAEREQRYQAELAQWKADVEAWEANGKVGKKPGKPGKLITPLLTKDELENLPELPQGWQWVFPEGICAPENYSLAIGPFGSNLKVSDYTNSGTPLVFVRHITSRNFDLNPKYISREKFIELLPHAVKSLDLLITKMGDPPGDCEIYPEGREEAVITADCLKFTIWSDYVSRKFYKYCINSTLIKKQLGLITQGVAQKKISLERFKRIKFPFPNLTEQNQIVEEIESRLSICDSLDSTITENLDRAEALRQSILKQAFEGKLVPQDPNDEPASVLLERIRAAKASQSKDGTKTRENRQGSTQQELFP